MRWLTEPLTKEAVSNACEDGAAAGAPGPTGWLAVFSSASCSAFAVEREGVRRALSVMAPVDAGLTLLRRFETAANALSWLAGGAPRDVVDVMTSSSVSLPRRASSRHSTTMSPPGSAMSRNVLPQPRRLGGQSTIGAVHRSAGAACVLKLRAAAACHGDGSLSVGAPAVEVNAGSGRSRTVCPSRVGLPSQALAPAACAQSLCFRRLEADVHPDKELLNTPALDVGVRRGAADSCGFGLGKRRKVTADDGPSAGLNPPVRSRDWTDGMLSRASLERMRIESKQYYDALFATEAVKIREKGPSSSARTIPVDVAGKGNPASECGALVSSVSTSERRTPPPKSGEWSALCERMSAQMESTLVSGGPGVGKTTFLRKYCAYLRQKFDTDGQVVVRAPTGSAAKTAMGVTYHSFFGFELKYVPQLAEPAEEAARLLATKRFGPIRRRLGHVRVLFLDEISMVPADRFDVMMELLAQSRGDADDAAVVYPFGDFLQLRATHGQYAQGVRGA
ncbi:hypothetical protein I4F81_004584 [Pyropia yezoensis]|uniref:Uncharacterized protein n=1 Tax=Pyropia yezoensis TaxID=2788 RepID=A0ACC3BWP5_PYRYE|nr:hypothetical protein I4F81_004584 [Neopyropia yezoensis]